MADKTKKHVPDVAKTAQHPQSQLKSQKELKTITDSKEYKEGSTKKQQSLLSWGPKDPKNVKAKKKKLASGGRVGKQFGGGLPIQSPVGANLQPTVGATPMGAAAPGRRFGMKHGSKSRDKKSTGGRVGYSDGGQVRPSGGWTD